MAAVDVCRSSHTEEIIASQYKPTPKEYLSPEQQCRE
jgi:hypothetical protein